MYKKVPLSPQQIDELTHQLTKITQDNMTSFAERVQSQLINKDYNIDSLLQLSQNQYQKLQNTIDNISQFAFSIMANFQAVWQEVENRDSKITELRQLLSSATTFMEELKNQLDEVKEGLSEAETYIQCIQQEKEYLQTIYSHKARVNNSKVNQNNLYKCTSEKSLRGFVSNRERSGMNYDKLRDYIQGMREERSLIEREYLNASKKLQIKTEQCKKANLLVEHLLDRFNHKEDHRELLETLSQQNNQKDWTRNELTSDDILKLLQKTGNMQLQSPKHNFQQFDQELQRISYHTQFESIKQIKFISSSPGPENDNISSFIIHSNGVKDAQCNTDISHFKSQSAAVQTDAVSCTSIAAPSHQESSKYRVSIQIMSNCKSKQKQQKIAKIIEQLNIQKQLNNKLKQRRSLKRQSRRVPQSANPSAPLKQLNNSIFSTYQYYHNKLVANRIKKYHFSKPDIIVTNSINQVITK